MSVAVIVVSLPALKTLIVRVTPKTTSKRSTDGYFKTGSANPISNREISRSHIQGGELDDEIELVPLDRKPSPSPTRTTSGTGEGNCRNEVIVTTNVIVTSEDV